MKKILVLLSLILITGAGFLIQCRKKDSDSSNPRPNKILQAPPFTTQTSCNCGTKPVGCQSFQCIDKLFGGQDSKLFTINWKGCVDPDPSNTDCNQTWNNGPTSTLKLCYKPGSCNQITAIIIDPIFCLPCLSNPYCITLGVKCHGANDYDFTGTDYFPNGTITVIISSDPKITVTCDYSGDQYNCSGELK